MRNEIKRGAVLGYVNMVVNIIVTFIYTPIMLKLLGQNEYGLYSLVASVISYLSVLDMGFGNAMIRFVSRSIARDNKEEEGKINGLFLFLYTIISVITLIIGFILIKNIGLLFSETLTVDELNKAKVLMIILVITMALSFPLSVFDSYIIANEKFTFIKLLNIIKTVLQPITILAVLYMGYKSLALVIITSVYTLLFHICNLYYCKKKLKMKLYFKLKEIDKKLFKEIAFYSLFIFLNIIVDHLYNNTDQIILGSVSGTIAVSIYAIATKITYINQTCSTTISGLFLPKITKTLESEKGEEKTSNIFIRVSRIQLYIMMLILSGFFVFGKTFITLWVGKEYLDAYYIVLLLIGPSIIPLTQNLGITIIQAKNKHGFRSIIYIIIAIINVFISIPLAKKYGGVGAAIGTCIATTIGQIIIMNIYYWKKIHIDIPKYWRHFIVFLIPIIFLSAIGYLLVEKISFSWLILILCIFLFTLIYLLICLLFFNKEEKAYINAVFNKLKKVIKK